MADGEQIPETQFTTLGDDRIAYQVFGEGDVDLIFLTGAGDCIDLRWDWPPYANYLRRLSANGRVIMFDQRGLGASDAPSDETLPSWERWADDARAVLDAVGSERAVLLGQLDAGATAILFAVAHPSRARGLILANTTVQFVIASDDTGGGITEEASRFVEESWGTEALIEYGSPDA